MGKKRVYRNIDFFKRINQFGIILKILYDCNRTSYLAHILYENSLNSFIIATENLKLNDIVYSGTIKKRSFQVTQSNLGWTVPLINIGLFTMINNIETIPYEGSQLVRAAGSSALLIGKTEKKAILKLNSLWELRFNLNCMATIGINSNAKHKFNIIGSAGKARNLGFRPKVRGVAKNPCDHPHGGGNGKHSSPVVPVTAFGKYTKWTHTKNKKKR